MIDADDLRAQIREARADVYQLRAHAVALAHSLQKAIGALEMDAGGWTPAFWREVKAPLDAPDLAALVERKQKCDAVIEAAWAVREKP